MYRGTTPKLTFNFKVPVRNFSKVFITFRQGDRNILEKTLDDCQQNNNSLILSLSQEDTLKFYADSTTDIQLRIEIHNRILATKKITVKTKSILKEGVI